jgi:hypothetical protein
MELMGLKTTSDVPAKKRNEMCILKSKQWEDRPRRT